MTRRPQLSAARAEGSGCAQAASEVCTDQNGPIRFGVVTPTVHRAGSTAGLQPLPPRQAVQVGLLVGWTTAVAAALDPRPRHRPVGTCWIAVAAASALLGLILRGAEGLVVGAVTGAGGFFLMIILLGLVAESLLFLRADRVWVVVSDAGRACAKVNATSNGAWKLTSVAAWPFNHHLGSHLIDQVCRDADHEDREIVLQAQNDRVARLYTRHQFVPGGQGDRRAMQRLPMAPGPRPGPVTEEMNLG